DLASHVLHIALCATLVVAQGHDWSDVFLRHEDGRRNDRFANLLDSGWIGQFRRILDFYDTAVTHQDLVHHGGGRGDKFHVIFTFEAFLHDVHMQQPEEAT